MGSLEKVKRDGKECCDEVVMIEVAPARVDDATNPRVPQRRKDVGGNHWGQSSSVDPGDSKNTTTGRWSQSSGDDPKSLSSGGQSWGQSVASDPKSPNTSSSQMLGLLEEFTKIYSDRLQRVEETAMKSDEKQYLEGKVCVLESWVRDLGEQNAILVTTVEELEKEAADRVALLEDRLAKMATTTRESCVSLRDHQIQVSSLVSHKLDMDREAQGLGDKLASLERSNLRLKEENSNLQSDLNNLVQVISRARVTGQWEADDLTFSCVTPEQIFGPVLSSSRRSSQSLKDSQRDFFHQMLEDHLKKDNSSIRSSFSNLQDADSSIYGSRGSDKDVLIMKLKADLRCSQSANEEINCQLVERDKQIADLQAQLTEMHHKLAESQAEVNGVTRALHELRHHNRHESIEVEAQLSENIDILASRLAELEEECQHLRDQHSALQDTHSLCAPTITMLQDQLSRSQQTQVELRTVLTAEVAERHDQVVSLKDQLKEQEQSHHETQMQLQLRNEVIKDLRKEIKELKEKFSSPNAKNTLPPVKEELAQHDKETKSSETQTCRIDTIDIGAMTEQSGVPLPNGFYPSSSSQSPQLSKLQNELAEKNVLLRELQSHLASSRQEVHLKDETLYKLEQKLNSSRREDGQKGERMQYLTGQLTSLQLEVGRTHGQAEHLRRQVENKNEILQKMENENSSLTKILNEKSATLERFQNELLKVSEDLEKRKKEVAEQRITISTLQDALVTCKRTSDELRLRLDHDVSDGMLHHSLPPQILASCNNIAGINPSVTKSISSSNLASHSVSPSACVDSSIEYVNQLSSFNHNCANKNLSELLSNGNPSQQPECCHPSTLQQPLDCYTPVSTTNFDLPDLRTSEVCAKNDINHNASCAINLSALPLVNGNSVPIPDHSVSQGRHMNGNVLHDNEQVKKQVDEKSFVDIKENINGGHTPSFAGQVFDV